MRCGVARSGSRRCTLSISTIVVGSDSLAILACANLIPNLRAPHAIFNLPKLTSSVQCHRQTEPERAACVTAQAGSPTSTRLLTTWLSACAEMPGARALRGCVADGLAPPLTRLSCPESAASPKRSRKGWPGLVRASTRIIAIADDGVGGRTHHPAPGRYTWHQAWVEPPRRVPSIPAGSRLARESSRTKSRESERAQGLDLQSSRGAPRLAASFGRRARAGRCCART